MPIPVLREAAGWLAVDKPPGVVVIPARQGDPRESLWRRLEAERCERLWVVHRLDRDTSGVMLFARRADAHRALCLSVERGEVLKKYLAFTRGEPAAGTGVIEAPLHSARKGKMRPASPGEPGARASSTGYRVLRRWEMAAGPICLIEAVPRTGRLHQVRVHLRWIGSPLLVDPLYGGSKHISGAEPGGGDEAFVIERLTLHASRIEFPDPASRDRVVVESPLPEDLRRLELTLDRTARRP
jgi:tRNA pseudouridine32 synthase/23S rRNA pseudouridine746 synthase